MVSNPFFKPKRTIPVKIPGSKSVILNLPGAKDMSVE